MAIGSNLPSPYGDAKATVRRAMTELDTLSRQRALRSSLWRTQPVDCPPDTRDFVNAVVALYPFPDETPETLLEKLLALESEFGRRRSGANNEARPLDLDLITFAERRVNSASLVVPHPRAHERGFVLLPLAEIAPDLVLPNQTATVAELARRVSGSWPADRRIGDRCQPL